MNIVENSNSFLFEVYAIDFGDNYHRLSTEPSTELERDARRIRRRYRVLTDYLKAVDIYTEYMSLLAVKHGGKRVFDLKLKYEMIEEFIPPKPRMKNTTLNKFVVKNKIMLSNCKRMEIDEEKIENYIENVSDTDVRELEPTGALDPVVNKIIKEEGSSLSAKKIQKISNIDYLEEYFKTKNVMKEEEELKDVPTVKEIMSGEYLEKIKDTADQDDVIFYRGNYMNRGSVEELQVYQNLGELGWNSLKVMKNKDVSKRITKIMKDKDKEEKKKKKNKGKKDDFLVKVAMDGDYDNFSDFEEDMLNFTASNIFK